MSQSPSEIAERAFRAFIRTSGLFRNRMGPYFEHFEISGAQWGVLRQLHRAESEGLKSLRLGELSERLLVRPPSVTTIVDRLQRLGLVSRSTASDDHRVRMLRLTPQGRRLVKRILKRHPDQIRSTLAALNEHEQLLLHDLMVKLGAHLESLEIGNNGDEP